MPDTFGFCWQLPQILHQGGIDYFVTQKLRWNDTTEFPYEWFEWRSPDDTPITSLMSAPIGTTIDPSPNGEYACTWERSTGHSTSLWLPGVGDHGGGPTRDMIELTHRWQQSPFFPNLDFSTAIAFLDSLSSSEVSTQKSEDSIQNPPSSQPLKKSAKSTDKPPTPQRINTPTPQRSNAPTPSPQIQNPKSFCSPSPHLDRRTLPRTPSRLLHGSRRSEILESSL